LITIIALFNPQFQQIAANWRVPGVSTSGAVAKSAGTGDGPAADHGHSRKELTAAARAKAQQSVALRVSCDEIFEEFEVISRFLILILYDFFFGIICAFYDL
jgi:hypothetical protein